MEAMHYHHRDRESNLIKWQRWWKACRRFMLTTVVVPIYYCWYSCCCCCSSSSFCFYSCFHQVKSDARHYLVLYIKWIAKQHVKCFRWATTAVLLSITWGADAKSVSLERVRSLTTAKPTAATDGFTATMPQIFRNVMPLPLLATLNKSFHHHATLLVLPRLCVKSVVNVVR